MLSSTYLFALLGSEERDGLFMPADPEFAQCLERIVEEFRNLVSQQKPSPGLFRYRFDPCSEIDRRSDHGEVEPIFRSDVAEEHRTAMQRDTHIERAPA